MSGVLETLAFWVKMAKSFKDPQEIHLNAATGEAIRKENGNRAAPIALVFEQSPVGGYKCNGVRLVEDSTLPDGEMVLYTAITH